MQPIGLGTDPQVAPAVLMEWPRRLSVQFGGDACGGPAGSFNPAYAVRRPCPDSSGAALGHRPDQVRPHPLALAENGEGLVGKARQPSAGGTHPETAFPVLKNAAYDIVHKSA